jgi:tripartite-type tricarboxylate transporter receptor subunit TctC
VPTFAEAGVSGMESGLWYGVLAPKRTPKHVIARLNTEFNRALNASDIRERFAAMGAETIVVPPEGFAHYMAAEFKRWGEVIRAANIKLE